LPGVSIRKDDEVQVLSGKDRGARGRVVRVLPREGRVMVEGIARAKKHARPSKQRQQGGIIDIEQYLDISNIAVVCGSCGLATRVGYRFDEDDKIRVCRKCGKDL
jgi:large subunit ribosomal protein L24